MSFQLLGSRRVGRGRFLDFQRLHLLASDRTTVVRDVIRHPGGVAILPVWGEDITMMRQYRAALGEQIWEIPSGKIDPGEDSLPGVARRELMEETGLQAKVLTDLGEILPSPGYTDERIRLFAATGLSQGQRKPEGAEERVAEVVRIPMDDALKMIDSGVIRDGITVVALLRWATRTGLAVG